MTIPPHNPCLVVPTDGVENVKWTNGDRADSAEDALKHYCQERGMDAETRTLSIDLITDILHLLHSNEIDPKLALNQARKHFRKETFL